MARNASFPEDEVQLQKQNRLQVLRADRSQADYLGREQLSQALFGDHPYSHIGPTEHSLSLLDKQSLESFRNTYLVPNNAYLVIVGQLPPKEQLRTIVTGAFGSWQKKDLPAYRPPAVPPNKKSIVLVDRPGLGSGQHLLIASRPHLWISGIFPLGGRRNGAWAVEPIRGSLPISARNAASPTMRTPRINLSRKPAS